MLAGFRKRINRGVGNEPRDSLKGDRPAPCLHVARFLCLKGRFVLITSDLV